MMLTKFSPHKFLLLLITINYNTAEENNTKQYDQEDVDAVNKIIEDMDSQTNTSRSNETNTVETFERIQQQDTHTNTNGNKENLALEANETCIGDESYCNMTEQEYKNMLNNYIYPKAYEWVLIATHSIVFVTGLLGNALVCIAVYRDKSMRTVTNYFIVNLALADFMVILFCLPPTVLWDVTETWFLGNVLCKMLLYFQSVSVTVSVLTLTFISLDRWYAICLPLRFKSSTGWAKVTIFKIWFIALTFNAPELLVLTVVKTVPLRFDLEYLVQCMATWSDTSDLIWHIFKVLFMYTIPLLLMTVAYCQIVRVLWRSNRIPGCCETASLASAEQARLVTRRKAAKMLVAVVTMFAVCYFPVHLLSVLRYTLDMEQDDAVTFLALVSHVLCYANSAINPLIYNFMSDKFRKQFRQSFCCASGATLFVKFNSTMKRTISYTPTHLKPVSSQGLELKSSRSFNVNKIDG